MKRFSSQVAALQKLLHNAITLDLICEALHVADSAADCATVAVELGEKGFDECGVRREGTVTKFVRIKDLSAGVVRDHALTIPPERIISPTDPLWSAALKIAEHGPLYVNREGELDSIVTKADLNKQPARLLMFGVVSMLEMTLLDLIRTHYEGESWRKCLTPNRIEKAEQLHNQREDRNEDLILADCLQLCDKADICIATPVIQEAWGRSKTKCRELFKTLRRIRDSLAHAQSPATDGDWSKVLNALREGHAILNLSVQLLTTNK